MGNTDITHTLKLTFKGDRDYLQGGDIIKAVLDIIGPVLNLSVQFHRKMTCVIKFSWVDEIELSQIRKGGELCAVMIYETLDGMKKIIALTEDRLNEIEISKPYDEETVIKRSRITSNTIIQGYSETGNFFERIIALNKQLLNKVFVQTPWIFVRIDLTHIPDDTSPLLITFKNKFSRGLYKSEIVSNSQELGTIMFWDNVSA